MAAENKTTVRRLFEDAWNRRNPSLFDELIAATAIHHDPANPNIAAGPQGEKDLLRKYTTAFPDNQFTVEALLAESDLVTARWSVRGTHKGPLDAGPAGNIPATGRDIRLTGIMVCRLQNGKIAETWSNWDALGMLQQVGALTQARTA